ncbi:MAG TPA: dethiobiotin synthase [Cyclobacteriaceae bacterium]|jgi:dethiobiotin synthetase
MNYFVTAIGTDSGKTVVSAVLCEALKAGYWKPIQAGEPRDSELIKELVSDKTIKIHPEKYLLTQPASPHAAARHDGIKISLSGFSSPWSEGNLIIEGAGGILVPLNDQDLVIDLVKQFRAKIILVCDLYLGSINHSLLTIEALKSRNLDVKGIVFNGFNRQPFEMESMEIILHKSGFKKLLVMNKESKITPDLIKSWAKQILETL